MADSKVAKKGNLFKLIKSMTKSEKRYFKLFASTTSNSKNYLLLFDAIDRQDEFDEKAIRKQFAGKTFVKQLHVTKNYLTRLIMKSLRNYHNKISRDAEIKDLLRDIEILFRRELFDNCHYAIEKARSLAVEYEKHTDLLEIYAWERKLLLARGSGNLDREKANLLLDRERESLQQIGTINEYWDLTFNLFDMLGDVQIGWNSFGDLKDHPLLKRKGRAETLQAKTLYHYILQSYHFARGEMDEAYENVSALLEVQEANPQQIRENPGSYITALNNKIKVCLQIKKYDEVPDLLRAVRAVPEQYGLKDISPMTTRLMLQSYNVELEMYRDTSNSAKGLNLATEVLAYLDSYDKVIPAVYRLLLLYQIAYLYFFDRKYEPALSILNELFRHNFGNMRQDIQSYAQVLRLMVHFELSNAMVMRYSVEAWRRFLKKKRNLSAFEKRLLKFFSKLSTVHPEKYPALFRELVDEVTQDEQADSLQSSQTYLEIKVWLDNKIAEFT